MEIQNSQSGFQLNEYITKINKQVKLQDLYHIFYLKPFECVLQQNNGGLPKGLKIVQRKTQNQYELKQIKQIQSFEEFSNENGNNAFGSYVDYATANNGDNLLSQMKTHGALQMAICICMYNEDKNMLTNTLQGVGQNIVNLCKQGVDPDKIAVIIIQDGIQKMDKSILELFKILETQSGMRFNNNNRKKNIDELVEHIQNIQKMKKSYGWEGDQNYIDINSFLFSQEEQNARQKLRFINVKKEYDEIVKLLKQVMDLQKKKTVIPDDLPLKAIQLFRQECLELMKKQNLRGQKQQDENDFFNRFYQQIWENTKRNKPLIRNALTKTRQFCKQYIYSRSEMSHVSFFRTNLYFPDDSGLSSAEIQSLNYLNSKRGDLNLQNQQTQLLNSVNIQEIEAKISIKMNIFFVIKYKNNQKLSSHNWFFNGFCKEFSNCQIVQASQRRSEMNETAPRRIQMQQISPKYSILLDVGLRPKQFALVKMYNVMDNHQDIGGVCGYMGLKVERSDQSETQLREKLDSISNFCLYFVDIQRAQQLEYHFAHLIDKGFQSIFKFIHVLPGAFSGYNMKAIWGQDKSNSDKLLESYFKSINQKLKNQPYKKGPLSFWTVLSRVLLPNFLNKEFIDPVKKDSYEQLMYESNVYLAEDRILCMGIHKNKFNLMFLPDAQSLVDPVKDIPSLMGQRKRWINGSFFAFQKVSDEFKQTQCCQVLNVQIWYLTFMNMLAFIAPGFYLFSISVAMEVFKADVLVQFFSDTLKQDSEVYNAFVYTINFIYAMLIFGLTYYSINLNNRNQKFVKYIYAISTILGIMSIIMLIILVVDLARGLSKGSSYLISNQSSTFIEQIPGGQQTVDIIRYVVLGIMGLYAVPLLFYSILFCNFNIIFQILGGAISFAFYTPTYLIVLNIYALCRMDDLSWGTKGLQAGSGGKDTAVMNNWKIIKTIHVAKFVFWNVVVAGLLIHFGSNYLVRFYLTFALMILIAVTMLIKVFLAIVYYIYYKIFIKDGPKHANINTSMTKTVEPSLYKHFKNSQNKSVGGNLDIQIRQKIKKNIEKLYDSLGLEKKTNSLLVKLFNSVTQQKNDQNQQKRLMMNAFDLITSLIVNKEISKPKNINNRKKLVTLKQPKQLNITPSKGKSHQKLNQTNEKIFLSEEPFEANSQGDLLTTIKKTNQMNSSINNGKILFQRKNYQDFQSPIKIRQPSIMRKDSEASDYQGQDVYERNSVQKVQHKSHPTNLIKKIMVQSQRKKMNSNNANRLQKLGDINTDNIKKVQQLDFESEAKLNQHQQFAFDFDINRNFQVLEQKELQMKKQSSHNELLQNQGQLIENHKENQQNNIQIQDL